MATILCVAALRLLVLQVTILELAEPAGSATALQPEIAVPPSVKATVPVGAVPATVAVNVTLAPAFDGLPELVSIVLVLVLPPIATDTVTLFLIGLPVLLAGTWLGLKLYGRIDEAGFRRIVLVLLLLSGFMLVAPSLRW